MNWPRKRAMNLRNELAYNPRRIIFSLMNARSGIFFPSRVSLKNQSCSLAAIAAGSMLLLSGGPALAEGFQQVNLVTDNNSIHPATVQDPNLVNAWGISFSATSPF
jgi:hypothetical protein